MALAIAVFAMYFAATAQAGSTQSSVFEDDHLLLWSGDAARVKTLDEMKAMGADTVHVLVMWDKAADLHPWDALVADAQARGLKVLMSPAGRGWPKVADYAEFVRNLAARYPSVDMWSFWNEPNHSSWLAPQRGKRDGVSVNLAAIRYRQLVQAGIQSLAATGHVHNTVLMGETAPLGSGHSTAPVDFYREVLCLDRNLQPLRGSAARVRECSPRPHFAISGVAHHPYTFGGVAKPSVTGRRSDAPIGALGRVTRVLDAGGRYGIVAKRLPMYLTEFGFQSRPPDPFGVSLAEQARFINQSDFIAYRNPRVRSVAQYTLRDDPSQAGFNTGLRYRQGKAKPALAAYALPIWVIGTHSGHGKIWGQVRAAHESVTVTVQHRANSKKRFVTVADLQTNARGYFFHRFPRVSGEWRLKSGARYSRVAREGA